MVQRHLPDSLDYLSQCGAVHGRIAAERAEQPLGPDESRQFARLAVVDGRHGENDIAERLGKHTSQPERDDRAKRGVALHADHEFAVADDHLLHKDGLESPRGPLLEQPVRRDDRLRIARLDPKHHETRLGLVVHLGGDTLHDHFAADPAGGLNGLGFACHQRPGRYRDAVRSEEPL